MAKFQPGQSGNPMGRPTGARNRLTEMALKALADDFEEHGVATVAKVRLEDPAAYLRSVVTLLPKDMLLTVQQDAGPLSLEERAQMRNLLALIARCNVDMAPGEVFTVLEDALRSHMARLINAA